MKIKKHLNFSSLRKQLTETFMLIPDSRQSGKVEIRIHDALMSGFACMYFQDPSLLQFQKRMQEEEHRDNLQTLFGVTNIPKETQWREIIDDVSSDYFRSLFKDYYLRLQRNKFLERYQAFPGLYYFPIDGSAFFSSEEIHCAQCLRKEHKKGTITYSHQVLQGGIMHPDMTEVIPFMPEQIGNSDGETKQDCEMNAAKRLVTRLRYDHPQLGLIIGGDGLFSKQPIIEDVLKNKMHYIFAAKPLDHKYLMEWIDGYDHLNAIKFQDDKGRLHHYEWMTDVPLNGREDGIRVNFFQCTISGKGKRANYKNNWVTDLPITEESIKTLVRTARCRWKNENECFNVMKNHGYCMDRNYGHGKNNLCFNFYLLTLLAFFFHQIFELTDKLYQSCRQKFGSKKCLWETLRSYIRIIIFNTWEELLDFALTPKKYYLAQTQPP